MKSAVFAILLGIVSAIPHSIFSAEITGELKQWHTVTLTFDGPATDEQADVNPFVEYELSVRVIHRESSIAYDIPGYFAADGNAAETSATAGSKWQVRFSPSKTGNWDYVATFKNQNTAMDLSDGSGSFEITSSDKTSRDFRAHGHLQYVGQRYLQFSGSGEYFLKAGVDSPETLLGYHDFDGTWHDTQQHPYPAPHNPIKLPSLDQGLHRYATHVDDWQAGDSVWQGDKGKGLIGGLNYLASLGVNSVYFLTMNVNGDGRNVWPWTDPVAFDRFDVSKLEQWEIVFSHMQRLGLQMHVVLQETENDHLLDQGDLGPNRKRYLREMVARFAHHPAIVWNLGEENLQTTQQQEAMANYLRAIDPYKHPIVIHNDHWAAKNLRDTFDPLLGKAALDGTAIQDFHWNDIHGHVRHYVEASRNAGKPWVVCSDEMGGANFGLKTDEQDSDHDIPRSKGLWGNLMAGGAGVEWYFGWQNNSPDSDLSAETWRTREAMVRQSKIAVDFFQQYLPFDRMHSMDDLTMAHDEYCFAQPGQVYCIYLPHGGNTRLNLLDHVGTYRVDWFNPRTGGELQSGSVQVVRGGQWDNIGEPPSEHGRDWVALIRRSQPVYTANAKGVIAVEAEHFSQQERDDIRRWYVLEKSGKLPSLAGAGEETRWVRSMLSAAPKASGNQFVRLLPDTRVTHDDTLTAGENFSPQPGKMAVLSYPVFFPQAGRYYVWVRAFSTGSEDNGLHVGLNGEWPASGRRMQWCQGKNQWTWGCAQRTEANHCGEAMQIYLDIAEAGQHTVQFSMREDGFAFDKFLLIQDVEYRPKDADAAETLMEMEFNQQRSSGVESVSVNRAISRSMAMTFPKENWEVAEPESQSVHSEELQQALRFLASHCKSDGLNELMIVRNGVCIYQGSRTHKSHNVWSCTKSVTGTLLGLLIADGKCSLDTKVCELDERLQLLYPETTLRHFVTMTSGYNAVGGSRWNEASEDWSLTPYEPAQPIFPSGRAFAYWDEAQMMLGRLLTKIAGESLLTYANRKIFEPIGMGTVNWATEGSIDGLPICNGCTGLELNAQQMARLGHLYLNRGAWDGQQIIPADWIEQATLQQVPVTLSVAQTDRSSVLGPGSYGFNWWVNGGLSSMPQAPAGVYYASGLNHNVCLVVPEWNLVIVRLGVDGNPAFGKHQVYNQFLKQLYSAMTWMPARGSFTK